MKLALVPAVPLASAVAGTGANMLEDPLTRFFHKGLAQQRWRLVTKELERILLSDKPAQFGGRGLPQRIEEHSAAQAAPSPQVQDRLVTPLVQVLAEDGLHVGVPNAAARQLL